MRKGNLKLIEFFETGTVELYDLSEDPEERNNLAASQKKLADELHAELKAWQKELNAPRPSVPNNEYDPTAVRKKGRDQRGKGKGRNKK
jgi:hypothetical protein